MVQNLAGSWRPRNSRRRPLGLVCVVIFALTLASCNWIAIGYSPARVVAKSGSGNSDAAARVAALAACRAAGATDCQVPVSNPTAYVALARSPSGRWGSGWGVDSAIADYYAKKICASANCTVIYRAHASDVLPPATWLLILYPHDIVSPTVGKLVADALGSMTTWEKLNVIGATFGLVECEHAILQAHNVKSMLAGAKGVLGSCPLAALNVLELWLNPNQLVDR
jgi:hypothetical protein